MTEFDRYLEARAKSQIIDPRGKLRGYNLENFSIFCEPKRPIPKPINNNFKESSHSEIKEILEFLKIKKYDQEKDDVGEVSGVFFEHSGSKYYIPSKHKGTNLDKNKEYRAFDLRISKKGEEYDDFVYTEKLAHVLREYTLYTFSLFPNEKEELSEKDVVIIEDYEYDILELGDRLFYLEEEGRNEIMYQWTELRERGRLIFPSQEILDACNTHLKTSLINDRPSVVKLKHAKKIRNRFNKTYDFNIGPAEVVFMNSEAARNYILSLESEKNLGKINRDFLSNTIEPYLFQNPNIFDNRLVIIQNVNNEDGRSYLRSKTIVKKWKKSKENPGYYTQITERSEGEGGDEKDKKYYNYQTYEGSSEGSFVCLNGTKYFAVLEVNS